VSRDLIRQIIVAVSLAGTIVGNGLANSLPFNGQSTGAVSDKYPVLFTPAGYVFAIWGVIYLALTAFAVYQFLPSQRDNPRLRRVGWLFVASGPVNVFWLWCWHHEWMFLSVLVMLTLLGLLIAIYLQLRSAEAGAPLGERLCARLPFSIYLAWISVATIANISIFLYSIDWSGFGIPSAVWAAILISIATLLGCIACLQRRDFAFIAVLVWAFIGIANKQSDTALVASTAWAGVGVLLLVAAARIMLRKRSTPQPV